MQDWTDLQGNRINDFFKNYRDALQAQRDANRKLLEQQRRNYFRGLMSSANKAGALYSNFPGREKLRYDTESYMPALVKAQTSYQTGLDSLRNNAVNLWNQVKSYEEAIEDYNY